MMNISTSKVSYLEIVNAVGSLASITGISLLWFKGDGPLSWENVVGTAMIVASCVGLASALAWLLLQGYRRIAAEGSLFVKVAYIGLGLPGAVLGGVLLMLVANKLFISINWNWFFQPG